MENPRVWTHTTWQGLPSGSCGWMTLPRHWGSQSLNFLLQFPSSLHSGETPAILPPRKLGKSTESRDTQALCANAECQGHLANTRQNLIQGPDTRPVLYPTQLLLLFLPWSLGVGVAMTTTQPITKGAQQGSPYKSPLPRKLKTDLEVRKGF